MVEYSNASYLIGLVVSSKLATLNELQTVYGLEDAYLLREIHIIDQHNEAVIEKARNK